jgi:hypothetical protein
VAVVPASSEKISIKYSINVKQYVLTQTAYNFWQNLASTTQQLGSLFDPQPSQVKGNVHSLTNPAETVVGYVSASTVQSKRIFIGFFDVQAWHYVKYYSDLDCSTISIPPDSLASYFPSSGPRSWLIEGTLPSSPNFIIVPADCADCRVHGGTNVKPSFWP